MNSQTLFPDLEGWEPTRDTLHWYARAVGVVPRAHAVPHPKWWHISLKVQPTGLVTDSMRLPGGGSFFLKMDLHQHLVTLTTSRGEVRQFSMRDGLTATDFGDQILEAVKDLGLKAEYARQKFENDEPRQYDPAHAEKFFTALVNADLIFKKHRAGLDGEVGPVQLWPHGFDLAFELFGTRQVKYRTGDKETVYPSQLNLGFSPGESSHPGPYFYSNPFPFEDKLLEHELPDGARWFTEGWQGSLLPYEVLAGSEDAEARLLEYARAVHEISAPLLKA